MAEDSSRQNLEKLGRRMRSEWDRRVQHDYRYWMSDGVSSDEEMWKVGARDFEFIIKGLPRDAFKDQAALEIGCGVGRLLRAASENFGRVVGIDVSEQAVKEARRLLADRPNVELRLGSGTALDGIESGSIDFAYSFAALSSMPVPVFVAYLLEISRVLKADGEARLQVYLGRAQDTCQEDTLMLRSFEKERFLETCRRAGFEIGMCEELVLPFEISDQGAGVVAHIVGLKRTAAHPAKHEFLLNTLLPEGEVAAGEEWKGSETEYLMALARAQQHMDAGRLNAAADSLEFAVAHYPAAEAEVKDMLTELKKRMGAVPLVSRGVLSAEMVIAQPTGETVVAAPPGEIYDGNMRVLRSRFPALAEKLNRIEKPPAFVSKRNAQNLPVFTYRGVQLIHEEKPLRAAETWAEQTLNNPRVQEAQELLIGGFGGGYQLEELTKRTKKPVHIYEPQIEMLKGVFLEKDCRALLERVASLSTEGAELAPAVGDMLGKQAVELVILPQFQALAATAVDELRRAIISARGIHQLQPRIAVVGPMYGGSLPIAKYTARALMGLKQRTSGYDLSSFYESFKNIGAMLRTPSRRDSIETQYVELISQSVLESINERPIDILICLAQAPMSPKVLTELRERGVITVMWFVEDCRRFQTWRSLAPYFDYFCIIQKEPFLNEVREAGAGKVLYLPVACDPDIHRPVDLTPEERAKYGSDISFLGAGYNNRRHMFAYLANRNFKIWGTEWPDCMPFNKLVQDQGRRIDPEEYNKIFNASTVNLNLHSSMERDGVEPFGDFVNPRTFELAAAGGFQLVDERTLLAEQFVLEEEAAIFHDAREMQDKIDFYVARPQERARIVQAARRRALFEHTYQHRMKSLLEHIYADCYERLKAREQTGHWHTTLSAAKDFPELEEKLRVMRDSGEDPNFDALIAGIKAGKGTLNDLEQKLLFLHHIRSQTTHVQSMRNEKE